jgi:hypothetical protein
MREMIWTGDSAATLRAEQINPNPIANGEIVSSVGVPFVF